MSKTRSAVLITAAIAVSYTTASWFIGNQIKSNVYETVEHINKQIEAGGAGELFSEQYALHVAEYRKGVFNSKANIVLSINSDSGLNNEYFFNTELEHGLFPLSELKTGSFKPRFAVAKTIMQPTDNAKQVFTETGDLITIYTNVAIDGSSHSIFQIAPGKLESIDGLVQFSEVKGFINSEDQFGKVSGQLFLDSIAAYYDEETEASASITGVSTEFATVLKSANGFDYSTNTIIDSIHIYENDNLVPIDFIGFNINSSGSIIQGIANTRSDYEVTKLKIDNADTGSLKVGIGIQSLNIKSLARMRHDLSGKAGSEMLSHNPVFTISPFVWENSAGTSEASLELSLQDSGQQDINAIKSLQLSVGVNQPMAIELFKSLDTRSNSSEAQSAIMASFAFGLYAESLKAAGVAVSEGNTLKTDLLVEPAQDRVVLNGNTMSINDLMQGLAGLMLGF